MTNEAIIVAIIVAIPPTVASILSYKAIHRKFNSRMDEFIAEVRKSAHAEGKLEGQFNTKRKEK